MRATKRNLATSRGRALCALALALPVAAWAAPPDDARSESQRSEAGMSQRTERGAQASRQVQGRVLQTRRIDLRGGGQNLLALVESERGDRRITVDLGSADAIQRDVSQGTQLAARGRVIDVRGRSVLVADQARIDGQSVRVQREERPTARVGQRAQQASRQGQAEQAARRQPARRQQAQGDVRQLRGEILRLKQVTVPGTDEKNRLALVRSERDDRRRIVDLGPVTGAAAAVSQGDRIHVRGPVVSMRGQQIMLARDVLRDGQQQRVQRPRGEPGQQSLQQSSQRQQRASQQQQRMTQQARGGIDQAPYVPRTEIRTQNGIRYVSGGVGNTSQQRMRELESRFPLRITLATRGGAYIGETPLRIEDTQGNTLLSVITEGPIFLADLPPGTYQVVAKHPGGSIERRRVTLQGQGTKNVVLQMGRMEEDFAG